MERGYLVVNVTGGGVAVPLLGATVKVFARKYKPDGKYDSELARESVINNSYTNSLATNSEGKTEQISIETPDTEISYIENGDTPYSVVDVYIEKTGYFGVLLFGVQIFPRLESILPVNLEPFSEDIVSLGIVTTEYTGKYTFVYFIPAPEVSGNRINAQGPYDSASVQNNCNFV